MSDLMRKIIRFGTTTEYVRHEAHWNVSAENAFKICMDYAAFITVMLRDQKDPPNPKWIKGGPGELGAQVSYLLESQGFTITIVEEVTEISVNELTGERTLGWKNISSQPWEPLVGYGCTWTIKPATDPSYPGPLCHLVWTNHFKQPLAFGFISLTGFLKKRYRRSSGPIMNFAFRQYYQETFPPEEKRLPKPGDRVAIVGAGPSGLHMAHLLKNEVGIDDITILERSDRHSGKTLTVASETHKAVVHELGTCYMHPAYFAVRAYMQELKGMPGCDLPGFAEEVEPIHYSIHRPGKTDLTLPEWITANLQLQPKFSPMALLRILLPKTDTALELMEAKIRYNQLHKEIFGEYNFTMPPRLSPESLARIDMSFGQFLEQHSMGSLTPLLAYGQTAQGYGSIEKVPAFWAMCWITPDLLDGYFSLSPNRLPRKAMFKIGWESMWDMTIKVNNLQIEYNTIIDGITRADDGPVTIVGRQTDGDESTPYQAEFDYLVVAAPLVDKEKSEEVVLDLTAAEAALLTSETLTSSQFRTILFKLNNPDPYLFSHLDLYADKVVGPETGQGDVFASRDSYLALHPEYCTPEGHVNDPAREDQREQMAYQWVENEKLVPPSYFDEKFDEFAMDKFGSAENYEVRTSKEWTYFQRYNRKGVNAFKPWQVLELQGRNRTLFVHASAFFESVLDIVNYNNMIVDGLRGKLNEISAPASDKKPPYYKSDHWKLAYNKLTRAVFTLINIVLGSIWTILYIPIRPILAITVIRWQRYVIQKQFKTANTGKWWQFNMKHFLKISPSVICYTDDSEDPVVRDGKATMEREHPEIPKVDKALMWNFSDYRVGVRAWMDAIQPTFLGFVGPRLSEIFRRLQLTFPVMYNYISSWGFVVSFNMLTGYSVRIEDDEGGGAYVPRCDMLAVAREEYGEEMGCRICTHVCKIFTEEAMARKGIAVTLTPDFAKGSCMIRGVPVQQPAYSDHALWRGMQATPATDIKQP